jgi:hypothetical protein
LEGELEPPTVNVIVSAQWIELRSLILKALDPFPDAQIAVAAMVATYAR